MSRKYIPNTCVSQKQFRKDFPDQGTAQIYLENLRWRGKVVCPLCGGEHASLETRPGRYFWCPDCKGRFTVRTGTIFHRSHIPLDDWLYAIYLTMTSRKGISSMQLSKELGITQKTAWYLQQRIREAFSHGSEANSFLGELFSGEVEIDETYLGGRNDNRHESKKMSTAMAHESKTKVVGLRERATGRTRSFIVGNVVSQTLADIVYENVEMGSVVYTDDFAGYKGIENDYTRKVVNHSAKQFVDGMAHTNGIESHWATLKRGFYGIYHWFSLKHSQRYVDEFAFRMNEGSCSRHSYERMNSALSMMFTRRTTYKAITQPYVLAG